MNLEGLSMLGRKRVKPSGQAVSYANPATGAPLAPAYYHATTRDAGRAVQLAARAFAEYGRWPGRRKAALLRRIAELFDGNAAAIQERAHLETALPPGRLQAETARTCGQLRLFAALVEEGSWVGARIDHADPDRKPAPKPDVRMMSVPMGPVVVFSSSNFPLAFSVAGGDTASALAAGCPVVVKAHQGHPGTSEMVAQLVQQAAADCGAPEGVFSMLYGAGAKVGLALVKNPAVKAVGFTGSRSGGRALMNAPTLLMLDEPSLGLSPLMAELVFERLAVIRAAGTTILLVEQNAACLEMATQGLIIANGCIVLAGDRQCLHDADFVRAAYFGL